MDSHYNAIPRRYFDIPLSETMTINVQVAEPDLAAENLALTTWASSFILASQLHKLDIRIPEPPPEGPDVIAILELGAGTGLVGITAAYLYQRNVVLTDLPSIVPGLARTITSNLSALEDIGVTVMCGSLDWKAPEQIHFREVVVNSDDEDGVDENEDDHDHDHDGGTGAGRTKRNKSAQKTTRKEKRTKSIDTPSSTTKAEVILAADTIYDEDHPLLVSGAVETWLARTTSARVVLCYPLRVPYLEYVREMWEAMEGKGLIADRHGQEKADESCWDDECLCEWVVWKWKEV